MARALEQQMADKYIERKKEYEVIITSGMRVGRVNGLAVIGGGSAYSGILLPIEAEVTPRREESRDYCYRKTRRGSPRKQSRTCLLSSKNISAKISKRLKDIFVQFPADP